ncbi:hypothetical protein LP422_18530 [Janibacter limosus]|uniref:Uncharacterized protein n=1 Tax=Janibacter limosus TaxID=53458 RepID=A0AC61U2Y3_9MICO|nr:hypothetical protein [Janibacter limosus]UUZ44401.1 hypothetical protein LP422_18530 [Janibacter limosus]
MSEPKTRIPSIVWPLSTAKVTTKPSAGTVPVFLKVVAEMFICVSVWRTTPAAPGVDVDRSMSGGRLG